jgi:hypothetical protein
MSALLDDLSALRDEVERRDAQNKAKTLQRLIGRYF